MDILTTEAMGVLGAELTKLAIKGTATTVAKKITAIKNEKDVKNIRKVYDEIVNELIQERDEAVRIAQSYKSELDRVEISDKDIEHLHNTISRILEIIKRISPDLGTVSGESLVQLNELINTDTLKTMQLLGFNFKAAIGDPFTVLCANAISSLGAKSNQNTNNVKPYRK